ncbi:60S ribosomal export protein NMD3 [Methanocella sp. MCL-LM]|uniref:60S ribosomal export protein NMD3 n=1 Tax=Methanocella sp. MCL-LM TaxID=3412035 RepID=UPI003C71C0E0
MVTTSKLFCPRCGKETEAEGLCNACFADKYVVFQVPQTLDVKLCAKCPSYKIGELWIETNIDNYEDLAKKAAVKTVRTALSVSKEVEQPQITVVPEFTGPYMLVIHVTVTGAIEGRPVSTSADIEGRVRKETCDICSRMAGGYYEAVIQVRAEGRLPTKPEIDRCLKIIENVFVRSAKAGDRLAFITDIFPLSEGADLYVGSTACARQASRTIVDEFGGALIESPKLVGAVGGKGVYRVTFSVRLPEIVAGDIVRMRNQIVLVEKVGKRTSGVDLATGQNTSGPEDLKLEKIANRSEATRVVIVSEEGDSVQILDPETYQAVTIRRPVFLKAGPGEEVPVIKTREGLFILPGGGRGKE